MASNLADLKARLASLAERDQYTVIRDLNRAQHGTPELALWLVELMGNSPRLRPDAHAALLRCIPCDPAGFASAVEQLAAHEVEQRVVALATLHCFETLPENVIAKTVESLKDDDQRVRLIATEVLYRQLPSAMAQLVTYLEQPEHERVVLGITCALSQYVDWGRERAVGLSAHKAIFLGLLEHPILAVRVDAALILLQSEPLDYPTLRAIFRQDAANQPDFETPLNDYHPIAPDFWSVDCISDQFHGHSFDCVDGFGLALIDPDPLVRSGACMCWGEYIEGHWPAVKHLESKIEELSRCDPDGGVRESARWALGPSSA